MSYITKKTAIATLLAVGVGGSLVIPFTARASEEGDRNSTYVLGALAGILGARGNTGAAVIAGAGAAVAQQNWQDDIEDRHRREDYWDDRRDHRHDRYDRNSYNRDGNYRDGYDQYGYDRDGYDRDGCNRDGYRRDGYDRNGYNRDGFNRDGYDRDVHNGSRYRYEDRRRDEQFEVRRESRRTNRNNRDNGSENRRNQRYHNGY